MSFRRDSPLIFPTGGRSQGVPGRGAGPRHQRPGLMCLRAGASLKPGNWAHPQRGGGQELTESPTVALGRARIRGRMAAWHETSASRPTGSQNVQAAWLPSWPGAEPAGLPLRRPKPKSEGGHGPGLVEAFDAQSAGPLQLGFC